MLPDVRGERAQAAEDAAVVFVVGAQLEAIALGDRQGQFERVDGIQAQARAEQRLFRIDACGSDVAGRSTSGSRARSGL